MRTSRLSLRAKTEIWLHLTAWAAGDALFGNGPGLRAMLLHNASDTRSSEMRLARLERKLILERQPGGKQDRIYRLTERGQAVVLGGRDPEAWWGRSWDGKWRVILFDLPSDRAKERTSLLRLLRDCGFGCVQGSVWLSPHPLPEGDGSGGGMSHPQSLLVIVGRPGHEIPDAQLVKSAWDWDEIEKEWRGHDQLLRSAPVNDADRRKLKAWALEEFQSWKHLMAIDPLLPEALWPGGYPGRKVWRRRCATLPGRLRILNMDPER